MRHCVGVIKCGSPCEKALVLVQVLEAVQEAARARARLRWTGDEKIVRQACPTEL